MRLRLGLLVLMLTLLAVGPAWPNPCALGGSGMGGTGAPPSAQHVDTGSGLGGTGHLGDGDGSGTGGTGHSGDGSGMGGTGRQAESGLGGTGQQAENGLGGTGIVGIITGFASVCVNGVEVHYDAATPVSVDGQSESAGSLAVGQFVAIEAVSQSGNWRARRIDVKSALVGPVSWISPTGDRMVAMGQQIRLSDEGAPVKGKPLPGLKPGDVIRVSGVRNERGAITATRVEKVKPDTPMHVTGDLIPIGKGLGRIGNLIVSGEIPPSKSPQVKLEGKLVGAIMKSSRFVTNPAIADLADTKQAMLQGAVIAKPKGGQIDLGYAKVRIPKTLAKDIKPGQWMRMEAVRQPDGSWQGQRIDVDPPRRKDGERSHRREKDSSDAEVEPTRSEREDTPAAGVELKVEKVETVEVEKSEKPEEVERPEKEEKTEKAERTEKSERAEKVERHDKTEKIEKPEKAERAEKLERAEKIEKPESPEKPEKAEKLERVEHIEKVEKIEKAEKIEKVERIEKAERIERIEKIEKSEKIEKPEKVERAEKPEQVERIEKVEKPEKIERPEEPERPEIAEKPEKIEKPEHRDD